MNNTSKLDSYKKKFKLGGENKELLRDSVIAFVIRVFAAISSFLMNMIVARRLGSFDSGNFFLCFAVITVLSTFVRMGGDYLLLRYVGIYGLEKRWRAVHLVVIQVAKRTFFFSILVTATLIIFHTFIAKDVFHKQDIAQTLFWMLLATPLFALYTLLSFAFQGLKKVMYSVSIQNVAVPMLVSILILVLKPADAVGVAKLYFTASALTAAVTVILWLKLTPRNKQDEAPKLPERFWNSSYILWTFAIFQMGTQWSGQFIAGIFCSQSDVAKLAVSQRTSMLTAFILIAINLVSAPKFANFYKQGQMNNLKKYAINSTRLMVLFATPVVAVMVFFPTFILSLFGPGFSSAAPMLVILALGQYINVLTGSVSLLLMMSGHEKDMMNLQVVVGVFCVVVSFVLVKMFGAIGASVAIALSVATQNLICVGLVKKRLGFNTLNIWSRQSPKNSEFIN